MEKGLHDSLFPRLYTLLKGQMVETLELPTFSGRAGSMDYTITKMKINNLDFGRFNIDLKKGEIVIIAEGIELSSKCHLKAWSSKIVKIKSSIDPTLKITNLNIEITIKLGKDDVEYTIATVHVGTFEMGSDNTGIKNKIFKNLANIASINESARKIFEKVLEKQLKSKITKILKKKLYEENKIPSYRKKALWIPDDAVDNCMKCKVVFTWYRRKHHCRYCGGIFCYLCSGNRRTIKECGFNDPVRVCDNCIAFFGSYGSNVQRPGFASVIHPSNTS